VKEGNATEFEKLCIDNGLILEPFGKTISKRDMTIIIK
jgi:hypothetical protein